jgi:hypothetical protein
VIPWLFITGAGLWYTVGEGEQATLLDTYLIGDNTRAGGALDRLENTFIDKTGYLLSHPMAALLGGLAILLLWRRTRAALYALAWLAVIWVPITLVATELQSRYLMAGVPALAVMFGGGMVIAGDSLGGWLARTRESTARQQAGAWTGGVLALVVIAAWAVGFAIPFARTATTDPGSLDMPHRDVTNYFSGLFTTWGTHDAFLDLQARGEQLNGQVPSVGVMSSYSDQIPVVGVLRVCNVHTLVMPDGFIWACMSSHDFPDQRVPRDVSTWTTLLDTLDRWPFVYVLTDYLAPDEIPGGVPGLTWDFFGSYPRPHDGRPVTVWRVQ